MPMKFVYMYQDAKAPTVAKPTYVPTSSHLHILLLSVLETRSKCNTPMPVQPTKDPRDAFTTLCAVMEAFREQNELCAPCGLV